MLHSLPVEALSFLLFLFLDGCMRAWVMQCGRSALSTTTCGGRPEATRPLARRTGAMLANRKLVFYSRVLSSDSKRAQDFWPPITAKP
jgi:hypothetical protein